jgi:putative ABC transport system permease protein
MAVRSFAALLILLTTGAAAVAWLGQLGSGKAVITASLRAVAQPVPWTPVGVLPVAGILIGGAMTATSLAGRRALDELLARHGEFEAALALGFTTRDAALLVCRPTAGHALVPALDQTRTVGLVTLPGAFVGVMLGGGSALQAGKVQVLVLIALLAVEAVAVVMTVELVAAGLVPRPAQPPPKRSRRPFSRRS